MRILYEDSRAATRGFGLHEFVLANIADVILGHGRVVEPYRLAKLIEAIPMKSDTKVLRALERDAERLHAGRTAIVAWLDDDKLHRPLGLAPNQSTSALIEAIQRRVPPGLASGAVRVHLVRGNVEQFLRRIDGVQSNCFDVAVLKARPRCRRHRPAAAELASSHRARPLRRRAATTDIPPHSD